MVHPPINADIIEAYGSVIEKLGLTFMVTATTILFCVRTVMDEYRRQIRGRGKGDQQ